MPIKVTVIQRDKNIRVRVTAPTTQVTITTQKVQVRITGGGS